MLIARVVLGARISMSRTWRGSRARARDPDEKFGLRDRRPRTGLRHRPSNCGEYHGGPCRRPRTFGRSLLYFQPDLPRFRLAGEDTVVWSNRSSPQHPGCVAAPHADIQPPCRSSRSHSSKKRIASSGCVNVALRCEFGIVPPSWLTTQSSAMSSSGDPFDNGTFPEKRSTRGAAPSQPAVSSPSR